MISMLLIPSSKILGKHILDEGALQPAHKENTRRVRRTIL
jgi:hypothetical protein